MLPKEVTIQLMSVYIVTCCFSIVVIVVETCVLSSFVRVLTIALDLIDRGGGKYASNTTTAIAAMITVPPIKRRRIETAASPLQPTLKTSHCHPTHLRVRHCTHTRGETDGTVSPFRKGDIVTVLSQDEVRR